MKKIIGFLVCLMIVLTLVPTISASKTNDSKTSEPTPTQNFRNCYVQFSGNVTKSDWPRFYAVNFVRVFNIPKIGFVFLWLMIFDTDSTVNVYSSQGGDLLYQHQGPTYPQVVLIRYNGDWVPEHNGDVFHITLDGNAKLVNILERK